MAKASVVNTTSTGTVGSGVYFNPPISRVVAQVAGVPQGTTATGSFTVEGSLNGEDWISVIGATTFANERMVTSVELTTGAGDDKGPFSALRAPVDS